MGIREDQQNFTKNFIEELAQILTARLGDIYFTNDFQTISFPIEFAGEERYMSLKATLHKKDWDLDDAIEEYEDKREMQEKKIAVKREI